MKTKKIVEEQKITGDKAYMGSLAIKTLKQNPKNEELSNQEKSENKGLASERIFVEDISEIIKNMRD
ncbi:MAG: hypothetical protein O4751_02620 [Trichodesmium sp. St2_bin6]|nr:hypothetical protein [Trichodesmium sp. St5_bin8]MDE5077207.1 hypothetical protein [Trichodesmium sp. St2_bin6]MDE5103996.1 hypothetical protein [Trichodesmium sp. St19_bin2]